MRQVQANCVALEAMNAPLALFQIDRVAGQIPVVDAVAIGVEIEPSRQW
jgi:hypothetical protein